MESCTALDISLSLIKSLIAEQFPIWASLPIKPVEFSGWDNRTFRLGEEMTVRLPSAERYSPQVLKEQEWLPKLAPHLSFKIPDPLALGKPSTSYPWHWSIYRWIDGKSANTLSHREFQSLAEPLARCLRELQHIDTGDGPTPGSHNFYRGSDLAVYNSETIAALSQLGDLVDITAAESLWIQALSSKWRHGPLWVHGDYSAGNVLVSGGEVVAIIDFGNMAVGDPACDLVLAWTNFEKEAREIFRSHLSFDPDTWTRARGWALWKAVITLAATKDKSHPDALAKLRVISDLLAD